MVTRRIAALLLIWGMAQLLHAQDLNYTLHMVDNDQALCLDGTKPGFYFFKGTQSNKWVIFFEGGGWCGLDDPNSTLADCYARSQTDLGSSKNYPASLSLKGAGILSPLQSENKYYYQYNKIYLKYCDGTGFQGFHKAPVQYQQYNLWFRGFFNANESINNAYNQLGMKDADEVVVSGCSAGAVGVFTWVDNIAARFDASKVKVYGVADAGVFMDVLNPVSQTYWLRDTMKNFMVYSNAEFDVVSPQCSAAYPNDKWKCMIFQYMVDFIKTPVFMAQSEYDLPSIEVFLGTHCADTLSLSQCTATQRSDIENYRSQLMSLIKKTVASHQGWGVWSPACVWHCFCPLYTYTDPNYEVPELSWNTVEGSLAAWRAGKQSVFMDDQAWPNNKPCSDYGYTQEQSS